MSIGYSTPVSLEATKVKEIFADGKRSFVVWQMTVSADQSDGIMDGCVIYGDKFTIKARGKLPELPDNAVVKLDGAWEYDKERSEPVFGVNRAHITVPTGKAGVVKYLTSAVPSFSRKAAETMYEEYGESMISRLANEEDFQCKHANERVNALLKKVCANLVWQDHLISLIGKADVSQDDIRKIVDTFGKESITIVKDNPYQLMKAVSFIVADNIAIETGESPSSGRRLTAALETTLTALTHRFGSLCVPKDAVIKYCQTLLNGDVTEEPVVNAFERLMKSKDFVSQGQYVYCQEDFLAERTLAKKVASIASAPVCTDGKLDVALTQWKQSNSIVLSPKQEDAVRGLNNQLSVVTGGPGTGKSTTLKAIIEVYKMMWPNAEVLLMAPTGLAARRMTETTGIQAMTIHSACGLVPADNAAGFSAQSDGLITAGLIVVDETSMVGEHLAKFIIDSIRVSYYTRIVFVGDVDQLAPVSAGNVLEDLINCGKVAVTRLDRNFRQGTDSMITTVAVAINTGDVSGVIPKGTVVDIDGTNYSAISNESQFSFLNTKDDVELTKEAIVHAYTQAVRCWGKEKTIVLSPTHFNRAKSPSPLSSDELNIAIQSEVNPQAPSKEHIRMGRKTFREGDRVIQLKNVAAKESNPAVINGDIGTITQIKKEGGIATVYIRFDDDKCVEYDMKDMNNVELAYCITVHKAQGCEYKCCIMPASMTQKPMLTRRLFYTAVTRAKSRMIIVGDEEALKMAARTNPTNVRKSLLGPRIIRCCETIKN